MAGTSDERDLWLLVIGAALMSTDLCKAASKRLAQATAPQDLKALWDSVRLMSKDGVSAALKSKGVVVNNGRSAGLCCLDALAERSLTAYCRGVVDSLEALKRLGDAEEIAVLLESYTVKIRAAQAAAEKEKA